MILIKVLLLTSFFLLNPVFTVAQNSETTFGERKNLGLVKNDDITEASGLAASVKNKGLLWTHNDSGDENRIFALDTNGNNAGEFYISGIENRDWEDIALGSGPDDSKSYIYIGDIGDNDAQHTFKYIYRIEEPTVNIGQEPVVQTISDVSKITFYYNDGERDAETLMIDAPTKDIYIVSKRDSKVRLYKLSYPQSSTNNIEAELAAKFTLPNDPEEDKPFNYITSGDISFDGTEILLKSYRNIYYWYRENGKSISEVLSSVDPQIVPFNNSIDETQSEAVCWKPFDDRGYYTLSEEILNFPAILYYYPRTSSITSVKSFGLKENFKLEQNYPNPFNPMTTIKYTISTSASLQKDFKKFVTLKIYDVLGKEIDTLVSKNQSAGNYVIQFDASKLTSGIYYYQLTTDNYKQTKKMVLLR